MGYLARRAVWGVVMLSGVVGGVARGEVEGLEYPDVGVSLIGPREWLGQYPMGKFVVARWEHRDSRTGAVRAVVEVRAVPGRGMTFEEFAGVVGRQFGLGVVDRGVKVDGVGGWRLEGSGGEAGAQTGLAAGPVAGVGLRVRGVDVVEHEGVMYAVIGGAVEGDEEWRGAVGEVVGGWKWVGMETPARRMRYLEGRRPWLLGGLVQMPMPVEMGVAEADRSWNEPRDKVELGVCNFKKGGDDFQMVVSVRDWKAGETEGAFRERVIGELRGRTKEAVAWEVDPDRGARRETPFVRVDGGGSGEEPVYERWATVQAEPGQELVVVFRVMTGDEGDRAIYERVAGYLFRNMEVARRGAVGDDGTH